MITLAEFLYLDTIDEIQSRGLLDNPNYANLSFRTPNEFRDFFANEGVRLRKESIGSRTERELLLERFKSFRGSTDYLIAKKYVEQQFNLRNQLQQTQTIESITSILNDVTAPPADPFFNFIIRKILTGSENGVLPSESLRITLDKLIEENSKEYYDENSDVVRDSTNVLESYQNIFKNKGRIRVPISDERFLSSDFRYIVNTSFESLQDAIVSEQNIQSKIRQSIESGQEDLSDFLSKLENLVSADSNSIAGLNAKIKRLEEEIEFKQNQIDFLNEEQIQDSDFLESLLIENRKKDSDINSLETTIDTLQSELDETLVKLESDISTQIENVTSAIDTLSQNVVGSANAANAAQDKEINDLKSKLSELESLLSQLKNSSGGSGGGGGSISGDGSQADPNQPRPSS